MTRPAWSWLLCDPQSIADTIYIVGIYCNWVRCTPWPVCCVWTCGLCVYSWCRHLCLRTRQGGCGHTCAGARVTGELDTTSYTGHWTLHLVTVFLVLTTGTGGDTWSRPGGWDHQDTWPPRHLAPPGHSTRLATSTRLVTCYPPSYDNLSILAFSGAVKTIKGDHVEIIYILPPTVSVQYAVCMFVSWSLPEPAAVWPVSVPSCWPPHPVLAESFTNYISISVSPAVTTRAGNEPSRSLKFHNHRKG